MASRTERITAILTKRDWCIDVDNLAEETFAELGMDTLDVVELQMDIENEFGIEFDCEFEPMQTPGDIVTALTKELGPEHRSKSFLSKISSIFSV